MVEVIERPGTLQQQEQQESLWLQYQKKLNEVLAPPAGEVVQSITPSTPWSWGGKTPPVGTYPYRQWSTCNVVAADPLQDTNDHTSASSSGFDRAYKIWLSALAVGDLAKDQHYAQLQQNANAAMRQYNTVYANAQAKWKQAVPSKTPTFKDWLATDGQAYAQQIESARQDMLLKQRQVNEYAAERVSPIADLLADYNKKDYQSSYIDEVGTSVTERRWTLTPNNYPIDYVNSITGNNFGGNAVNGNGMKFSFDHETSKFDYRKYFREFGGGAWDDFLGIGYGEKSTKIDWSRFSNSYRLEAEFQDLTSVLVQTAGWYSQAGLRAYAQGPYATGFHAFRPSGGGGNYFFGPGGALSRIYTALVVAYRPKVTLTTSQAFSDYVYEKWQQAGGVEIGPFVFGGERSEETTKATASKNGSSVTWESKANWPMIIGMRSAWTVTPNG